jgi:hypothetical protein
MDAADEALAAQPKFVDPLSLLPPGTFVMDGNHMKKYNIYAEIL